MATPGRSEDLDLTPAVQDRWPIAEMLDREPYRFEFFQAVRLLGLMNPGRRVVGRFSNPRDEVVRFGASTSINFPPSQTESLDRTQTPAAMRVAFATILSHAFMIAAPPTAMEREP